MAEKIRQYVAIDAKSFYASVECVERHLNPLTTNRFMLLWNVWRGGWIR